MLLATNNYSPKSQESQDLELLLRKVRRVKYLLNSYFKTEDGIDLLSLCENVRHLVLLTNKLTENKNLIELLKYIFTYIPESKLVDIESSLYWVLSVSKDIVSEVEDILNLDNSLDELDNLKTRVNSIDLTSLEESLTNLRYNFLVFKLLNRAISDIPFLSEEDKREYVGEFLENFSKASYYDKLYYTKNQYAKEGRINRANNVYREVINFINTIKDYISISFTYTPQTQYVFENKLNLTEVVKKAVGNTLRNLRDKNIRYYFFWSSRCFTQAGN